MTDAPDRTSEIAAYQLAVERHLSDLPEAIREDLLSDLDAHLAEVAADLEPGASLMDLLGSPEAYARELRETAEIPKERRSQRIRRNLAARFEPAGRWSRNAAEKFAASAGVDEAERFWRSLTPAWWILRGVLAAMVFIYWFVGELRGMSLFSIAGLILLSTITLAFVWLSIRIGVKTAEWSRRRRRIVLVSGLALVVAAAVSVSTVWNVYSFGGWGDSVQYVETDRWGHVQDVYVYNEEGELITGVYLFDQAGEPIELGDPWACEDSEVDPNQDWEIDPPPSQRGYRYPLCGPGEFPVNDGESPSPEAEPTAEETTDLPGAEPTDEASTGLPGAEPTGEAPTTEEPTAEPTEGK